MRIIIQMGDSYPDDSPCAKRMRTFYEAFIDAGHEVSVLAPKLGKEQISHGNIHYCPTFSMKKKTTLNRLLNSVGMGISSFFLSLKLGEVDCVITTCPPPLMNIFGWMIAKVKRAKLVYDVRDIWPDIAIEMGSFRKNSVYYKCFAFVRNFMLHHASLIIAVSPGKVKKLKAYDPDSNVKYVPNGLDLLFLDNDENPSIVEKYKMREKDSCVYIGNLGLAQGLDQLIYIAEKCKNKYPKIQFLLFGSGVEEEKLKALAKERELDNIVFPGRIPNRDIFTVLKYAKISFVPLVNENLTDSVPTKLFEALGVGCPVLLAAVGDSADIVIESRLGRAVPPRNKQALWDSFCDMYENIDEVLSNKNYAISLMKSKYSRQNAAIKFEKELRRI